MVKFRLTNRQWWLIIRLGILTLTLVSAAGQTEPASPVAHFEPLADPVVAGNVLVNPGFSAGMSGWSPLWTRLAKTGSAATTGGMLRVSYTGTADWAVSQIKPVEVQAGEIWELAGFVGNANGKSTGEIQLGLVSRNAHGEVLDWSFGQIGAEPGPSWTPLRKTLLIPADIASLQFRVTGFGSGDWVVGGLSFRRIRSVPTHPAITTPLEIRSNRLLAQLDPILRQLTISQLTNNNTMASARFDMSPYFGLIEAARQIDAVTLELALFNPEGSPLLGRIILENTGVRFTLDGNGAYAGNLAFPGSLMATAKDSWVLPINEGIMIGATDPAWLPPDMNLVQGHGGLSMPFVAITNALPASNPELASSWLWIAATPDDGKIRYAAPSVGKPSAISLEWLPSRQSWRYRRESILMPLAGDYVAIAKAYRSYATTHGLVKTLREKEKEVPAVARLIGAANVWWWGKAAWWSLDKNAGNFAREMAEAGIKQALWSHEQDAATIRTINGLGFLAGRYDIYSDVWGPDDPNAWVNHEGWPANLQLEENGAPRRGWVDKMSDGREYPGGVLCSETTPAMERAHVNADLKSNPYSARFIDTTTATPLMECYDPAHPMTRSDDKANKLSLFDYLVHETKLIAGSETGYDAAVPRLHYFEGMMSLAQWRLPDSGYDLTSYKKPDQAMVDFQFGPKYRIPLFELVYHDCVVNYWYWGDASNRLPEFWDRRDTLNALYGTPPLWVMDPEIWKAHKSRFVTSFRNAATVARQTGYSEMTSHQFLTADRSIQETRFADGTRVIANFGNASFPVPADKPVAPGGFLAWFPDGSSLRP